MLGPVPRLGVSGLAQSGGPYGAGIGLSLQAYHFLLLPINVTKQTWHVEDVDLANLWIKINMWIDIM